MLGKQPPNTDLFQCVTVESLVPPNHVLRRLHAALDLGFVRDRVAHLYARVGRPSVAPEVVVRLWILQHFYALSERQLCDEVTMHAGFRWFCGLSFNDPVPDQSTLVKLRTEKWANSDLWQELLAETVRACEAAGIVRPGQPQRVGVDGTQIEANAAIVSLEAIPPEMRTVAGGACPRDRPAGKDGPMGEAVEARRAEGPAAAGDAVNEPDAGPATLPMLTVEQGGNPRGLHQSGDPDWRGERFSNGTHRSTTDPQARLYRKAKGQEAKLRYLGHYLADLRSGVICDAMATMATGTAEREAALTMLQRMEQPPGEAAFDLGYRDGDFLAAVLELGIQPLVPLQAERLEVEPQWQRRTSDIQRQAERQRRLAAVRARNATRLAVRGRRGASAQQQRTRLEHLFGEAKEHHGLRRAHGRGLVRVDQQLKLTASVQNLKRLLRGRPRREAAAMALPPWVAVSPAILAQIDQVPGAHRPRKSTTAARTSRATHIDVRSHPEN